MSLFLCLIINIIVYSNFLGFFFGCFSISRVAPSKAFRRRRTRTPCCVFWARRSPEDIQCERGGLFACTPNPPAPTTAPPPTLPPATNVRCFWSQVAPAHSGSSIQGRYCGDRRGAGVAAVVGGGGREGRGEGGGRG